MLVNNKLSLAARLVIECLREVDQTTNVGKWEQDQNIIKVSINGGGGKMCTNMVALTIEPEKKCMISLYTAKEDRCLGHSIFQYERDLGIIASVEFPIQLEDFIAENANSTDTTMSRIAEKLNIDATAQDKRTPSDVKEVREAEDGKSLHLDKNSTFPQGLASGETEQSRRPPDMPSFEDEYEVFDTKDRQGTQGTIPFQYGDTDLYPTGERHPNLTDPTSFMRPLNIPGQGGMVFDPLREQSRQRQEQEQRLRGPGYMPGAKFDDPFGNPGGFGSGGPGGPGFGGGGFI